MPSPSLERGTLAIEHDIGESEFLELFETLHLGAEALLELHLAAEHLEIVDAAHLVVVAHILGYQLGGEHDLGSGEAQVGVVRAGAAQLLAIEKEPIVEANIPRRHLESLFRMLLWLLLLLLGLGAVLLQLPASLLLRSLFRAAAAHLSLLTVCCSLRV